jgi:hypothetical protein
MPFGIKSTRLLSGKGPTEVDFDALWNRAILPALERLDYLPVRADNQTGSVIVKDMLEQLVHADLVLADISIPNGNVYYEAGVRHAARDRGCILLRADWSKPLFDLAQITQLRYPGPPARPIDQSYDAIIDILVNGIPALCDSLGPVHELTNAGQDQELSSRRLKEVASDIFQFQQGLKAACLRAAADNKDELRALLRDDILRRLPGYALRDLIPAVRDHLHWGELIQLIDGLPSKICEDDPFFYEHKAHALSKLGNYQDAVALMETIVTTHGETPERLGTLGGRYRELARNDRNNQTKRRYIGKAIEAYRRGMQLDLNQYYCAHKLLVALVERGRASDRDEAQTCNNVVRAAAGRARELNSVDEWIDSTMTVLSFYNNDSTEARRLVDLMLDSDWHNWKLVSLVIDLDTLLACKEEDERVPLQEILEDLRSGLPVAQETLMVEILPQIKVDNRKYEKFQPVHARPAQPGEVVVSTTADGEETTNTASEDDYVVQNLTDAKEKYLVGRAKFEARYTLTETVNEGWSKYLPKGEVLAIEITRHVTDRLNVGEEFYIMAPWGSEQLAREGDMFVSPLPGLDEVYRIARKEFDETYRLAESN